MIDIYNEKLAKYADGERRIFTATFCVLMIVREFFKI